MDIPFLTVDKVAELVGRERPVEVLEVSTQTDRQMILKDWAAYFALPAKDRERILNV
jgi:F-box/leucine-rich repeat protein 10/11